MTRRLFAPLLPALLTFALLPAPALAKPAAAVVDVVVAEAPPDEDREPRLSCSGVAPAQPGCVRSMTLTGDFTIGIALANTYRGYLVIRGFTETGSTTVVCDFLLYGPPCEVRYEGTYFEGQTWTMVVVAAGSGYWSVTVR